MENFYDWKPEYLSSVVGIFSVTIGFSIYWFLSISTKIKNWFFEQYKDNEEKGWVRYVVFQKLSGALFMGIIPGIICLIFLPHSLSDYGVNFNNFGESMIYIAIIGVLIALINRKASNNHFNLSMYPQMRVTIWNKKRILVNSMAWITYLSLYEFMYRGILLMTCYYSFGFWPAVAINISYYSATHIAKGMTETIGTFPYGILLCYITLSTGSIFVAVATHLILALTNDYFSVGHSKNMRFG